MQTVSLQPVLTRGEDAFVFSEGSSLVFGAKTVLGQATFVRIILSNESGIRFQSGNSTNPCIDDVPESLFE
jgi:hypothetical protein